MVNIRICADAILFPVSLSYHFCIHTEMNSYKSMEFIYTIFCLFKVICTIYNDIRYIDAKQIVIIIIRIIIVLICNRSAVLDKLLN